MGAVHPDCIAATEETGRLLESLGHLVEPSYPSALHETLDMDQLMRVSVFWLRMILTDLGRRLGRRVTSDDVEPFLWQIASMPFEVSAEDVVLAQVEGELWGQRVAKWWAQGYDLLLTPTVFEPPATLEELTPAPGAEGTFMFRVMRTGAFTLPFNLTGQPAISLPLQRTAKGLPVGVQLVAAMAREDVLIRVASQLEQAAPWKQRRPSVSA